MQNFVGTTPSSLLSQGVCLFLANRELHMSFGTVCKEWCGLSRDTGLLQYIIDRDFPTDSSVPIAGDLSLQEEYLLRNNRQRWRFFRLNNESRSLNLIAPCSESGGRPVSSGLDGHRTQLLIVNGTDEQLFVRWVGFDGALLLRQGDDIGCAQLPAPEDAFNTFSLPIGHFKHETSLTHAFVVTNAAGEHLLVYQMRNCWPKRLVPSATLGQLADIAFHLAQGGDAEQVMAIRGRDVLLCSPLHCVVITSTSPPAAEERIAFVHQDSRFGYLQGEDGTPIEDDSAYQVHASCSSADLQMHRMAFLTSDYRNPMVNRLPMSVSVFLDNGGPGEGGTSEVGSLEGTNSEGGYVVRKAAPEGPQSEYFGGAHGVAIGEIMLPEGLWVQIEREDADGGSTYQEALILSDSSAGYLLALQSGEQVWRRRREVTLPPQLLVTQ
jgi:hypothetical protein